LNITFNQAPQKVLRILLNLKYSETMLFVVVLAAVFLRSNGQLIYANNGKPAGKPVESHLETFLKKSTKFFEKSFFLLIELF